MKRTLYKALLFSCILLVVLTSIINPSTGEKLAEIETLITHVNTNTPYAREIAEALYESANRYDICRRLLISVAIQESDFRAKVIGEAGEEGIMQLKPETAAYITDDDEEYDLLDPKDNIDIGARYLKYCILKVRGYTDTYGAAMELGLTAYNRGPWRVMSALEEGRNPRNGYEREVLERRAKIFNGTLFD